VCFENARRNPCNFTGSGQLSNFGTGWLNSNTLRDDMKADISLGSSGASNCWTRQMKDAFGTGRCLINFSVSSVGSPGRCLINFTSFITSTSLN
jgi:hypothetical protein